MYYILRVVHTKNSTYVTSWRHYVAILSLPLTVRRSRSWEHFAADFYSSSVVAAPYQESILFSTGRSLPIFRMHFAASKWRKLSRRALLNLGGICPVIHCPSCRQIDCLSAIVFRPVAAERKQVDGSIPRLYSSINNRQRTRCIIFTIGESYSIFREQQADKKGGGGVCVWSDDRSTEWPVDRARCDGLAVVR